MVCIYVITDMLNMPLAAIGNILGGRDHTTIMHGAEKIEHELESNDSASRLISTIKKKLNPA